ACAPASRAERHGSWGRTPLCSKDTKGYRPPGEGGCWSQRPVTSSEGVHPMIPVPVAAPRSPTDSSAAEPTSLPTDAGPQPPVGPDLTRRGFLRGAALTGGGLMAATLAACAPSTSTPGWTFGPLGTAAPAGSP